MRRRLRAVGVQAMRHGFCNTFREAFDHVLQFDCREAWSAARSTELSKSWREILSRIDESDRRTLLKTTAPKQTLDIWKKAAHRKEVRIRQLTAEQVERTAACESAAELQALAKSEGIALTDEEAEAYFAELTDVQVSDDELDEVAGGDA